MKDQVTRSSESASRPSRRASAGCCVFALCLGAAFVGGMRWAYDLRMHPEVAQNVVQKETEERVSEEKSEKQMGKGTSDLTKESTYTQAVVKSQDLLPGEDRTPEAEAQSVKRLAAYLKRAGKDDRERVGLIYRWVTAHIAYDVEGFRRWTQNPNEEIDEDADAVLRTRKGVCEGYANLFRALASEMDIQCEVVPGYGRGVGYRQGEHYAKRGNHAWNAVMLDGHWCLLDSTWGAGYVDVQGTGFVRRFEPFYFLTPPEQFRYSHYPKEDRWQLCSPVLSQSEHERLPYLRPAFFTAGLELDSHPEAQIDTDGEVRITLRAPDHVALSATVNRLSGGAPLPDKYAFVQREDGKLAVRAIFPEKGDFLLRIFVAQEKSKTSDWAMDYRVTCHQPSTAPGFPTAFTPFHDHDSRLIAPLSAELKPGQIVDFQLSVPGASTVAVTVNNNRYELTHTQCDNFHGTVNIVAGKVVVWATFNKRSGTEDALLEYSVHPL